MTRVAKLTVTEFSICSFNKPDVQQILHDKPADLQEKVKCLCLWLLQI